ncbi:LysE family translocator [Kitasatospora sp. NPDC059571]|uniref:LysE family translocator n=1 Tax=Kitasatospora sp. NPDC059571 TaxID=3346871 RepID=UPI0036A13BDA
MRHVAPGGRGRAAGVVLGTITGLAVHATLALAGLSALVMQSAEAFAAVRLAGALYLTLLPQFLDPHRPMAPQVLLLGCAHALLVGSWLLGWTFLLGPALRAVQDARGARLRALLERVTGLVLVGLGVRAVASTASP